MSKKSRRFTKGLKVAFSSFGVLTLGYVGSILTIAWLLVRPGKRGDYDCVPEIEDGELETVTLKSSDGLRLHAWILRTPTGSPDEWVLLLHGYRSDRLVLYNRAQFFTGLGFNVLLLHFRGHGHSSPARITYGYRERKDVKAAFEFIRSLRPDRPVRIGIDGISMGAAAAAYAVAQGDISPDWIILESCYDHIRHALANRLRKRMGSWAAHFFAWPVETVVGYLVHLRAEDLDPAKALEKSRCPLLLLAGDSEVVLKMVEIEYLFGCIPEPKRLVIFPGAGHEDLRSHDPQRYDRAVRSFFHDLLSLPLIEDAKTVRHDDPSAQSPSHIEARQ